MRPIKKFFNLIEITLAVVILAVGISSVLVLFPVGINANKEAIAENNIPNVSEYLFAYLEAFTMADWNTGTTTILPYIDTNDSHSEPEDNAWSSISGTSNLEQGGDGYYKYTQYTNGYADFSAIIKVWKEQQTINNPLVLATTSITDITEADDLNEIPTGVSTYGSVDASGIHTDWTAISYCIEISYPAELPYASREKYFFRKDLTKPTN